MSDRPEPMTPPDCNLRGLPWMPLETTRLLDSDLFILSTGDEFKAAVALWCKSWNQVPGGSLPSDERLLEALSGSKTWKKVRDMAMRNWVLCSDGRYYHPVVAEQALQAWDGRQDHRETADNKTERQRRWREQLKALSAQLRAMGVVPPSGASKAELERLIAEHVDKKVDGQASTEASTGDADETGNKGEGEGQGDKKGKAGTVKPSRPSRPQITFAEYLERCRAERVKPVPDDHYVRTYCRDAGIPDEMLQMAWIVFKDRHLNAEKAKRQKDWAATFANSVKGRWYQLWYVGANGAAEWTATGLQEKRVAETRMAAAQRQEGSHAPA